MWQLHKAAHVQGFLIEDEPGDGDCALHSLKKCLPQITDSVQEMRGRLADHLLAELQTGTVALEIEVDRNMPGDPDAVRPVEGLDAEDAYAKAIVDLTAPHSKYWLRGPHDGAWIDFVAILSLAKIYRLDFAILNPNASWTVVRELEGQAAPNYARMALLQTPSLRRSTDKNRLSSEQREAVSNGSGHFMALRFLGPAEVPPRVATPSSDLSVPAEEIKAQIDRRSARITALADGTATTAEVDDFDRLMLERIVARSTVGHNEEVMRLQRAYSNFQNPVTPSWLRSDPHERPKPVAGEMSRRLALGPRTRTSGLPAYNRISMH